MIGVGIVVAVAGLTAYAVWVLRGAAVDAARARAEDHAASLAEHAAETFFAGRYVLDNVVQHVAAQSLADSSALRQRLGTRVEHELLRAREGSFLPISMIAVADAGGDVVALSRGFPAPSINIADRESFRVARDGSPAETYVSAPVRNRADGLWTIYLSRKLLSPRGQFIGVAMTGLSCQRFTDFYLSLRLDRRTPMVDATSMTLLRNDLTVLARAPFDEHGLGHPLRDDGPYGPLASTPPGPASAPQRFGPWDADPAIEGHLLLTARAVRGFPVQVAVAARDTLYLAEWRRQAAAIGSFGVLAMGFFAATFSVLVRVLRRREQHLEEAQRLRKAAEAASRVKSEFLATVSHEIRTPMNGILGTADLLVRSPLPPRELGLAETLLRSGRNLLGIINDILDLSKIEAGELQVEAAAFCPRTLMREVQDLFEGYAAGKGITLSAQVADDVPPAVTGDANRVRQVLGNLASNAIKFSDTGQVQLRLKLALPAAAGTVLRFEVEDWGVGIPASAQPRVFQPFAQADGSVARRFGGTGLGLAISKRLVELMGGTIDFRSREGHGTCFWFELPMAPARPEDISPLHVDEPPEFRFAHSGAMPLSPAEPMAQPGAVQPGPNVLVVEDNPVNAVVVEAQLARLGCSCDIAVDGDEALNFLRSGCYDVVLMDCMLPGMSGYELTGQWRREEQRQGRARLPIIALTANALASNVDEARQAGMDDFLTKPCTVDKLATVLRRWLAPDDEAPPPSPMRQGTAAVSPTAHPPP